MLRSSSVPQHLSVSQFVKLVNGKAYPKMMVEFKMLSRAFWGRRIWARGYFVASSGNVTDEVIMKWNSKILSLPMAASKRMMIFSRPTADAKATGFCR